MPCSGRPRCRRISVPNGRSRGCASGSRSSGDRRCDARPRLIVFIQESATSGIDVPDEELVRRAVHDPGGDAGRRAASQLFQRYSRRVYRWCYGYVADHEEALDLAQDVLLSAFRRLETFAGRSRFSWWVFAITRNRCRTAKRPASLTRDPEADVGEFPDETIAADTWVEWQEDEARLLALLDETLDPVEWDAIFLRCSEGVPVEEITRALGIVSASGARGVLQSARRKLRRALARRSTRGGSAR
ncbi:MAG: RNA polymerase sigma factor [Candidatus Eiseniibacteriota bacterium]